MVKKRIDLVFVGGRERGHAAIVNLTKLDFVKIQQIFVPEDHLHEKPKYAIKICEFAKKNNISCEIVNSLNHKQLKIIQSLNPDLMVVFGWRTLIPKEIYSLPKKGTIAIHNSLLPEGRGFAPSNWDIILGKEETGVTLLYLSENVDEGDIIAKKKISIPLENYNINNLIEEVVSSSISLLEEYLPQIKNGTSPRIPQDNLKATYYCSRGPEDGKINWRENSICIYNLIRGLTPPFPGAFTFYKGEKIIIVEAGMPESTLNYVGRIPGRIINISDKGVEVLTGDKSLLLKKIQTKEGKLIEARQLIKSVRDFLS